MEKKKLLRSNGDEEIIDQIDSDERPCYLIKVPSSVCKSEEIILFADKITIESGVTCFIVEEDDVDHIVLCLTPGSIRYFYMVDPDDLSPLGIHRWQGITGISKIVDQDMVNKAVKKALYENTDFVEVMEYITDSLTKREEEIVETIITENVIVEETKEEVKEEAKTE